MSNDDRSAQAVPAVGSPVERGVRRMRCTICFSFHDFLEEIIESSNGIQQRVYVFEDEKHRSVEDAQMVDLAGPENFDAASKFGLSMAECVQETRNRLCQPNAAHQREPR